MKKILMFIAFTILLVSCQKKQDDVQTAVISTPTVVCGTCEKTIKKALAQSDGVYDVKVDIKKKVVEVQYRPRQTNVETIEMMIADAGYDANSKKRDPNAYENLPACCKND